MALDSLVGGIKGSTVCQFRYRSRRGQMYTPAFVFGRAQNVVGLHVIVKKAQRMQSRHALTNFLTGRQPHFFFQSLMERSRLESVAGFMERAACLPSDRLTAAIAGGMVRSS